MRRLWAWGGPRLQLVRAWIALRLRLGGRVVRAWVAYGIRFAWAWTARGIRFVWAHVVRGGRFGWAWVARVILRRRPAPSTLGDPWAEQRIQPGLWVAMADAMRKGG